MRVLLCYNSLTVLASAALFFWSAACGQAQDVEAEYDHWPEDLKIKGTVIAGRGLDAGLLEKLVRSSGERKVVIVAGDGGAEDGQALKKAFVAAGNEVSIGTVGAVEGVPDLLVLLRPSPADLQRDDVIKSLRTVIENGNINTALKYIHNG
jgi:hypothetical protein